MSNKVLNFFAGVLGDGTTTVFTFDLKRDPVSFVPLQGVLSPEFDILKTLPRGVFPTIENCTMTLAGAVITATFATAPAAPPVPPQFPSITNVSGSLLF